MVILVFVLLIALVIAIFALKNSAIVVVDLFFTQLEMSQAILILIAAALGALVVLLMYGVHRFKTGRRLKALQSEINRLQKDLDSSQAKLAVSESELRSRTSKTLEESIYDGRVTGYNAEETFTDYKGAPATPSVDQTQKLPETVLPAETAGPTQEETIE